MRISGFGNFTYAAFTALDVCDPGRLAAPRQPVVRQVSVRSALDRLDYPTIRVSRATIRAVDILDSLARRLPDGAVVAADQTVRERAIDSWALALLRRARGDDLATPAAVVFPSATEDVAAV